MAELPKMLVEDPSRHLREALLQEQLLPSPCHWRLDSVWFSADFLPSPVREECHGPGYL
jgi:hypothetical protein